MTVILEREIDEAVALGNSGKLMDRGERKATEAFLEDSKEDLATSKNGADYDAMIRVRNDAAVALVMGILPW